MLYSTHWPNVLHEPENLWSSVRQYTMTLCTPWSWECCCLLQCCTHWPDVLHEPENVVVIYNAVHNDLMYSMNLNMLWSSASLYTLTQCTPSTWECCGRLQRFTQWPNVLHKPETVLVVCHAVHIDPMYSMNLRMLWSSATLYTMTQCMYSMNLRMLCFSATLYTMTKCTPWTWECCDRLPRCTQWPNVIVHHEPEMLWSSAMLYTMTQCTPWTWECCGRLQQCTQWPNVLQEPENAVVVCHAVHFVWRGPAHAGHQVWVLRLLNSVRCINKWPRY